MAEERSLFFDFAAISPQPAAFTLRRNFPELKNSSQIFFRTFFQTLGNGSHLFDRVDEGPLDPARGIWFLLGLFAEADVISGGFAIPPWRRKKIGGNQAARKGQLTTFCLP